MKLRNIGKTFINSLPVVAIAILGWMAWNQHQNTANARVDYDTENPKYASRPNADRSSKHLKADRVLDGDTIKLQNGETVRLCGIDAPEKSQPLGMESKARLQRFIDQAGYEVILVETELDRFGRIVGDIFVKNRSSRNQNEEYFVNGEMVRSGMAYHYERYSRNCSDQMALKMSEELAKSKKLGVWSSRHEKPWDFRRRQRER